MQDRSSKRPTDPNQLAKLMVDIASREVNLVEPQKNEAAVALGRLGGKKGGRARALSLSPEERSAAAKRAADVRWASKYQKD